MLRILRNLGLGWLAARLFERGYAKSQGTTVGWLRGRGQQIWTCDCREAECKGFQQVPGALAGPGWGAKRSI